MSQPGEWGCAVGMVIFRDELCREVLLGVKDRKSSKSRAGQEGFLAETVMSEINEEIFEAIARGAWEEGHLKVKWQRYLGVNVTARGTHVYWYECYALNPDEAAHGSDIESLRWASISEVVERFNEEAFRSLPYGVKAMLESYVSRAAS
ncbi:MAG: hypothetical protein A3E07_00100 [Candidatus Wildermuthbacteria bacterium RIFCSPHIGHO2_12_FULL_45_9]|uniref:Nudix hydrolase domain-containing protein n=1 Tax=Candidatus Wildermuthbacteria bacterium RIFCSPHIGHO2_02_FULL_45_25 TaxID=1802450 RepID=A0A1G2QYW6_9BACT|nr:MAG: hypothetical protein A2748_01415 [Candidatus Wildermuthbacteria bacterium RIFCSPHIGHO2_01_FULL_45_20]OHA65647.1 MAG: hypothetical protein A3C04_01605 [Candidatus Wildermuthbacteria bacterium RIFCSPHIGHO2_02_FULL_45_25]OHA70340.1 MAG: hypothetical protein A3E07_00100 [Candidatus Wildermuthbacteria bacterium RIFCSPHIGHO2_12_FULL_45_9]